MGAPRDLPSYAVIHPSVNEMVKAGILDKKSIPRKGGNNLIILPNVNVMNISNTWKSLRKSLPSQATSKVESNGASQANGIPHKSMEVPAKSTS